MATSKKPEAPVLAPNQTMMTATKTFRYNREQVAAGSNFAARTKDVRVLETVLKSAQVYNTRAMTAATQAPVAPVQPTVTIAAPDAPVTASTVTVPAADAASIGSPTITTKEAKKASTPKAE